MEEDRPFYVYIVASGRNGTLYIGHTDDIVRRACEHAEKLYPGFTRRYGVGLLVWYEMYADRGEAFTRERQMKKWNREGGDPGFFCNPPRATIKSLGPRLRGDDGG